jgi:hypothetical protein
MFVWYGCDCGRVVFVDDNDNSGWMKSDGGRQRIRPFQVRRCACVIARHDEKVGRTRRSCVVLLRKVNLEHWGGDCSHLRVLSNPIGSSRRISLRTSAIEALGTLSTENKYSILDITERRVHTNIREIELCSQPLF